MRLKVWFTLDKQQRRLGCWNFQMIFKKAQARTSCGSKIHAQSLQLLKIIRIRVLKFDKSILFKNPKDAFSFRVPLKHIFGFCDEYNKVVYGFKHQLTLVRKGDNDTIFRGAAADSGKVVLSKLSWYMPHVTPNLHEKLALYKLIESKSSLPVGYQMIQCDSIPVLQTRNFHLAIVGEISPGEALLDNRCISDGHIWRPTTQPINFRSL